MLENIPQTSPLIPALEKERHHFIVKKKVLDVCPYIRFDKDPENVLRRIEKKPISEEKG